MTQKPLLYAVILTAFPGLVLLFVPEARMFGLLLIILALCLAVKMIPDKKRDHHRAAAGKRPLRNSAEDEIPDGHRWTVVLEKDEINMGDTRGPFTYVLDDRMTVSDFITRIVWRRLYGGYQWTVISNHREVLARVDKDQWLIVCEHPEQTLKEKDITKVFCPKKLLYQSPDGLTGTPPAAGEDEENRADNDCGEEKE